VALPFKVASSSQAKQGEIIQRLTLSPPDHNWATWPIFFVASLPAGNSGGCPHQEPHHSDHACLLALTSSSIACRTYSLVAVVALYKLWRPWMVVYCNVTGSCSRAVNVTFLPRIKLSSSPSPKDRDSPWVFIRGC